VKTKLYCLLLVSALLAGLHLASAQTTNLGIAPAGNQTILFWQSSAPNFFLQSTTNLASTNWVNATDAVPVTAFTVSNTAPGRYFRLGVNATLGMALIPASAFILGDQADTNHNGDAAPTAVLVSAFYMDTNPVSYFQWQGVYNWATSHGYGFDNPGAGKAANHPVQTVDWYDTVKWSNARSQQLGLRPVYYTDAGLTQVYTNGDVTPYPDWTASGYRLPTEAEWEKAARGGLNGLRFPWGSTISETQANYFGATASHSYDLGPNGYNATGSFGGTSPATSPVGSFAANAYGLCDMAGNVDAWCWDWYGTPYAGGADPRGPASGTNRVMRGGDWQSGADVARCANRSNALPTTATNRTGFRCVKTP